MSAERSAPAGADVGGEMICPKAFHDMEPYGDSGNLFHCPRHGVIVISGAPGAGPPGTMARPAPDRPSSGRTGGGSRQSQNGRSPTMATRSATRRCGA